jgi:hypothetical protein
MTDGQTTILHIPTFPGPGSSCRSLKVKEVFRIRFRCHHHLPTVRLYRCAGGPVNPNRIKNISILAVNKAGKKPKIGMFAFPISRNQMQGIKSTLFYIGQLSSLA